MMAPWSISAHAGVPRRPRPAASCGSRVCLIRCTWLYLRALRRPPDPGARLPGAETSPGIQCSSASETGGTDPWRNHVSKPAWPNSFRTCSPPPGPRWAWPARRPCSTASRRSPCLNSAGLATDVLDGMFARALSGGTAWGKSFDAYADASFNFITGVGWPGLRSTRTFTWRFSWPSLAWCRPSLLVVHSAGASLWSPKGSAAWCGPFSSP
jgi:hypothetical protein